LEEMKRRVSVPIRNKLVWFASPEDIVVQKLDWYRKGEGISERQWRDAVGVVAVQGDRFDAAYARRWARHLELGELLEKVLAEGSGPSGGATR
ncbi:MAG TPA: hypothetical protein VFZ53_28630, partial [Polyangiaceae bacterium]